MDFPISMRYPETLDPATQPFVTFTPATQAGEPLGTSITLYCPPSHRVSDGASYNNFDLGIFGGAGQDVMKNVMEGDKEGVKNVGAQIESRLNGIGDGGIKAAVLSKAFSNFGLGGQVSDRVRDLYMQSRGQAINPNTVLQFQNTNIRSYGFSFKMVAESSSDSNLIREITRVFRKYMYPEKDEFTLQYPAKWKITFHKPGGSENDYLPKIFDCYLESMSATFNANGSAYHKDGAPLEVDVSLTFKETKALARVDIERLQ